MPGENPRWILRLISNNPASFGRVWFIFCNSCAHHILYLNRQRHASSLFVSRTRGNVKHCGRKKWVVTNIRGKWQPPRQRTDWPGEKWWKRESERERQVVSGTIQLPSELYWISPPFKIKRQISLNLPLDPKGRITLFFSDSPEAFTLCLPPFQRVLYNSEHCGILLLKLCIFKYQVKLQKSILFFSTAFFYVLKKKEALCGVCVYVL